MYHSYLFSVVFGADKTKWGNLKAALRRGDRRDGPVTLILERRVVEL